MLIKYRYIDHEDGDVLHALLDPEPVWAHLSQTGTMVTAAASRA